VATEPLAPPKASLYFQTANYLLRPLTAADVSEEWGCWLADERSADLLNAPCRRLSRHELELYVSRFDNVRRILLGIFHRPSGAHIGIYTLMESRDGRHVLNNVLVGARGFRSIAGIMEMREIRAAVCNYIFFDRRYLSAIASVVATNQAMIAYLKLAGWQLMKRSQARTPVRGRSVELLTFQLTRERYIAREGATWARPS
jgi:RimJ/RimL family protein N-acetyltransferase